MFGLFRLIAALLVLITHIGGVPFVAGAAVWGFFMLSGLLMAGALNFRYGLNAKGVSYSFAFLNINLKRKWELRQLTSISNFFSKFQFKLKFKDTVCNL